MELLLDSHALLWWLTGDRRLPPTAREQIADGGKPVWVSAASLWELSIKAQLGRLDLPDNFLESLSISGFQELAIHWPHAELAAKLPPIHSDPFDRMLVAQTSIEGLRLVTRDERLAEYGIPTLWR